MKPKVWIHPIRALAGRIAMLAMLGLGLVARPAEAAGQTQVIITVDVESKGTLRLPFQMDAICTDGTPCGLMEFVRQIGARGWPATLFLNAYEQRQLGDAVMRDIARRLQDAGQDVELHTHPDAAYDASRGSMHEYTLDEQTSIVRDGVRMLQAWTGQPVVAHRAGAYAADERTLAALQRNGVQIDSSVFWQDVNSRLDGIGLPRNLPAHHGALAEIPVTVYERRDHPRLLGSWLAPVTAVRKIDPDWIVDAAEGRAAIDAAVAARVPYLVVFLHSFSFMEEVGPGVAAPDRQARATFAAILDQIAARGLPVVTMRDIAAAGVVVPPASVADVVPGVDVSVDFLRYTWRRIKPYGREAVALGGLVTVLLLSAGALLFLRRRRVGRRPVFNQVGAPPRIGARQQ